MLLTEIINIQYPIISGGMANIATGAFAAAVSNAGGLGVIGTGAWDEVRVREEIRICKSLTDKPFGVNIMLMNTKAKEIVEVICEEKVQVVTTGAGNPGIYVNMLKESGCKVFPVVPTISLARRLERYDVDAFIFEGTEAGGHVGETTTMALIPQAVNKLKTPIIAAGGIATGKQLNAAFALGAIGVQIGTCLLVSKECPIHDNYKQAVLDAKDNDTVVTGRTIGVPVRNIRNKMTRTFLEMEKAGSTAEEMEHLTLGGLRKSVFDGDVENGSIMAGQVAGLCEEILSVKDILEGIITESKKEKMELINKIDSL